MFEQRRERRELVVSVTLAETFLLLVFLVWYVSPQGELPDWKSVAAEKQKRVEELERESKRLREEIDRLQKINQWWKDNFGVDCPASYEELVQVLRSPNARSAVLEAGRGYAACEAANILIEAEVRQGSVRITYGPAMTGLQRWLAQREGTFRLDEAPLENWDQVKVLASLVRQYYEWRARGGSPCRFDYKLVYHTKEDYYDGRVILEQDFYPAGIRRALP